MSESKPITIIIADDHKLFRQGIISLFDESNEILIIDEAENGNELIEKYFSKRPDILLIDISMPELNGVEAFKQIRKKDRAAKGIFLTMYEGEEYIYQTMRVGAKGLLSKNVVKGELIYAIKKVYDGGKFFGKNYNAEKLKELDKKFKMISDENNDTEVDLNNKEIKILEYLSKGKTSVEIADLVCLSKKSIDYYRSKIMIKLGIKTLPELISFAIRYSNSNKLFEK